MRLAVFANSRHGTMICSQDTETLTAASTAVMEHPSVRIHFSAKQSIDGSAHRAMLPTDRLIAAAGPSNCANVEHLAHDPAARGDTFLST